MAINLLDWRQQRQWQLLQQWLFMNLGAVAMTYALWCHVHTPYTDPCTETLPPTSVALPYPTHAHPSATHTPWRWADGIIQLLAQWPKTYQLNTLTWHRKGIQLFGECSFHCNTQALLQFCAQHHMQLINLEQRHTNYQFKIYHAHTLPLP